MLSSVPIQPITEITVCTICRLPGASREQPAARQVLFDAVLALQHDDPLPGLQPRGGILAKLPPLLATAAS
jgi:hypothetical protein